jgi:hypothetical protein
MKMEKTSEKPEVAITLTKAEALVLFDLLSRFSETGRMDFEHNAENQVLLNVCCILESALTEPFSENYEELLQTARVSLLPTE